MKSTLLFAALALALSGTVAAAAPDDAQQHDQYEQPAQPAQHADHAAAEHVDDHAGHDAADVAGVPADHQRWQPDAPLQEGMRRMREAMDGLHHHEMGHLDESQVEHLATAVDDAAAFMFANCELDPEPDVALHGVLARLMAGAKALHADPADPAPVASMRAALEDYPRLFDDPTFFEPAQDDEV